MVYTESFEVRWGWLRKPVSVWCLVASWSLSFFRGLQKSILGWTLVFEEFQVGGNLSREFCLNYELQISSELVADIWTCIDTSIYRKMKYRYISKCFTPGHYIWTQTKNQQWIFLGSGFRLLKFYITFISFNGIHRLIEEPVASQSHNITKFWDKNVAWKQKNTLETRKNSY